MRLEMGKRRSDRHMTLLRLAIRNVLCNRGIAAAAVLGVAVATAALTGSLMLGDSARASLREAALGRLGDIDAALSGTGFFGTETVEAMAREADARVALAAAILLPGSVTHAESGATVAQVNVIGVNDSFWRLFGEDALGLSGRSVAVNARLARDLGVKEGDALVTSARRGGRGPGDTLFGRRERGDVLSAMRTVAVRVLPDEDAGMFSLARESEPPRNLFVSRDWLAEQIGQAGRANTLLASLAGSGMALAELQRGFGAAASLEDWGVRAVASKGGDELIVSSTLLTLSANRIAAAQEAAGSTGSGAERVSVYLANTLASENGRSLAYAMVAGLERPDRLPMEPKVDAWRDGDIVLNAWAARALAAKAGDALTLRHFAVSRDGTWPELTRRFIVRGVAAMEGAGGDSELVPEFEGLTEAQTVGDWDPPFPVDFDRVTDDDEAYWQDWRAAPKAFVGLAALREMWGGDVAGSAAEWVTSLRVAVPAGRETAEFLVAYKAALLSRLAESPGAMRFEPVREQALAAAEGSQDMGTLFVSMSVFVMAAALMMAGMMMRLALGRRAAQTGLMLACGFKPATVRGLVILEGVLLAVAGAALSVPLAVLYAGGLARALGETGGVAVRLRAAGLPLGAGTLGGGLAAGLALGLAARALTRARPLDLLAGWQHTNAVIPAHRGRIALGLACACVAGAGLALAAAPRIEAMSETVAFFVAGGALLVGGLSAADAGLIRILAVARPRVSALMLALRSLAANRGRSLTTAGLFAAASFVLVAVAANRRDFSATDATLRGGGTGGFALQAMATMPIHYDFGTSEGRARLGFGPNDEAVFDGVRVFGFLSNSGDDVSCLNAAQALNPRVAGVGPDMIARGGFKVRLDDAAAAAIGDDNPWTALNVPPDEGAIPVFGDADSVMWQLHSGLGRTLTVVAADGSPVDVRVAGILAGSVLAGELLMAERHFRRLFPDERAPRHFLIETTPDNERAVAAALRRALGERGLDVWTTRERLNALTAVQNTYMTLFLALGGMGVLLGVFGLGTLLVRGALERKAEFALMTALGFGRSFPARLLVLEHALALGFGLALGTGTALTAVAPALRAMETDARGWALAGWPIALAVFGLCVCLAAARFATAGSPIQALRKE